MDKFIWHNEEVPKGLNVQQVYGIIFTKDGRMLLRVPIENGVKVFTLAGGTTEDFDRDAEDTLRRELIEEINVTIEKPIFIGYQTYDDGNGEFPFAQVRMVAMIDKIGKRQPDPDTSKTYERLLVSPKRAIQLLNWGEPGRLMIEQAVRLAKSELGLNVFLDKDEYI